MNQNSGPVNNFMKFLQFPLTRILLGFVTLGIVVTIAQAGLDAWPGDKTDIGYILLGCIVTTVCGLAYYGFVRVTERRAVTELSFQKAKSELIIGVMIGAMFFFITIGILWILGYYRVLGVNPLEVIVPILVFALFHGVFEELLFRGILFRVIEESLGTWLAMAISALLFGALHLTDPNATLWSAIAVALTAGITLSATFAFSHRLWIPIGIHIAWNFTQRFFGLAVSGNNGQGLLNANLSGPILLSGGAFGVEDSILIVIMGLGVGVYFLWRAWDNGNLIKPFWKQTQLILGDADAL
jgi:membrane protease YdiL (CAAX protease family)